MIEISLPEFDREILIGQFNFIPKESKGIYFIYSGASDLLYIGKASNLKLRLQQHLGDYGLLRRYKHHFHKIRVIFEDCPMKRDLYETFAINTLKPILNKDKVFLYEQVTTDYLSDIDKETEEETLRRMERAFNQFGGL